jgi:hypothetical protein
MVAIVTKGEKVKKQIRAIVARPFSEVSATEIGNDLRSMQALVDGLIQIVPVGDGVALLVNEKGKLYGLKGCMVWPAAWDVHLTHVADIMVGVCALISNDVDEDGDAMGLTPEQETVWLPRIEWAHQMMIDSVSVEMTQHLLRD